MLTIEQTRQAMQLISDRESLIAVRDKLATQLDVNDSIVLAVKTVYPGRMSGPKYKEIKLESESVANLAIDVIKDRIIELERKLIELGIQP